MIEFHLDTRSGVPTYLQLVQQVTQAVRLGILQPGDQLPTVKEVVGSLATRTLSSRRIASSTSVGSSRGGAVRGHSCRARFRRCRQTT